MTAYFLPDLVAVSFNRLIVTRTRRLNALLVVQNPHAFFISELLMFAVLFKDIQYALASFHLLRRALCGVDTGAICLFQTAIFFRHRDDTQAVNPVAMLAISSIFFIVRSSTVRQARRLPQLTSENGEWRDHDEFHVAFILKDVAITAAPAWNIGVVVIFGEVQFEHSAFGAPILQGVDRIQTV